MTIGPESLGSLIDGYVHDVPGVAHAVVLSTDLFAGVRVLGGSAGLPPDRAEQLAAIASGLVGLVQGAARSLDGGAVNHAVVEMERGYLMVMSISDSSSFAAVTLATVDLGRAMYEMVLLAARLRRHLPAPPRSEALPEPPAGGLGYAVEANGMQGGPAFSVGTVERTTTATFPVSIYLSDDSAPGIVESAVVSTLALSGAIVVQRDDPIRGSWFRRMRAQASIPDLAATAAHAVDSRLVLEQDARVTAALMEHIGPVIAALQNTRDAVIRLGAVLIVKIDDQLVVHQLTASQQLQLDHQPNLALSPREILTALQLSPMPSTRGYPQP